MPENACYLTLVRRMVSAVLAHHGFIIRETLVDKDRQIAIVLTLTEGNIQKEAVKLGISKAVDIGVADLLSLEPVDILGRPMRLNSCLYDESVWNHLYSGQKSKDELNKLRRTIHELVTSKCSMKKLVRLANSVWSEPKDADFSQIYRHVAIELGDWEKYRDYLIELSVHTKCIEHLMKKAGLIHRAYFGDNRIVKRGKTSRSAIDSMEIAKLVNRLVLRAMTLCKQKSGLRNIWDLMKTPPMDYTFKYVSPNSHMRPRVKKFHDLVWADYLVFFPHTSEWSCDIDPQDVDQEVDMNKYFNMDKKPKDDDTEVHHYLFTKSERLRICNSVVGTCY